MAGRHIKELLAAYRDRDDLAFRRAASAIIEEEESKRHTALARDLRKLLATGGGRSVPVSLDVLPEPPRDRDSNAPLADVVTPQLLGLGDLVFPQQLRSRLERVAAEVPHWPALDAAGVPRRNRVLLYGPPGNGKSSIADALAGELGWPLVVTRVDGLVSSYLGETASNLRSLFEFASATSTVVLLDEFDSLGKLRDDPTDHGELRRVVNATLQLIESYRGRSLLIAATNTPDVLDTALWRRFDEVVEVPLPTEAGVAELLTRLLGRHVVLGSLAGMSKLLAGLPYAAVEHAAYGARRRAVLAGRTEVSALDLDEAINETMNRPWL